ncbi:hypothetical protein SAMN05660461_0289 [Chitinophaga ginsengisegetis]|uniref:Baseplate J-like protein n=1 Tax=Chitinophaga ginsengisegetis TaxID=393003 RepID=A0A1T5N412_9BACT|nr:hypothetical protein [Chitinophaga ginsengisegetis]SKC95210.1 hypothetical protein SAMN05660461_0289 [Chitinophaga ginsengisegetis]
MSNYFENIQDGVSQLERQLDALQPAYVKVDDRSTFDLLAQLTALSSQFNYYNFNHQPDGDWQEFFHADLVIMLIICSNLQFTAYEEKYLFLREAMGKAGNEASLFKHTAGFFSLLYDIAIELMDVLQKLSLSDKQQVIRHYADQVIQSVEEETTKLYRYELQVKQLFPYETARHHTLRSAATTARLQALFPGISNNTAEGEDTFSGFFSLNEIYDTLRTKFYQTSSSSSYYLKNQLHERKHTPHMGLLMTFTELYKHLQDQINEMPKRHLDYYYRTILGMEPLHAVPDKVHILIMPAPQVDNLTIDKGEIVLAPTIARKEPLKYQLRDTLKVHATTITAVHTLYVSNYLQIAARSLQTNNICEAAIYHAIHPVIPAPAFAKLTIPPVTWPLLGEDQHDLSQSVRTMENTSVGFMIGSPALYLTEGSRSVQVRVHFNAASYAGLIAYLQNFSAVTGRNPAVITSELMSGAFLLYYTTPTGWAPIKHYNVRCSAAEQADNAILINFLLRGSEAPSGVYNPEVHGANISSALPLVKILLNNNSFHHSYSFLRHLVLERVTVTAKVTGFRAVKLDNNIGELNAYSSFRIFGPMPAVGSFLDICNTNVFNKYTKDFSIKLEWLELPKNINGFDTYFAAYPGNMTNNAYKVGLSSINNGVFLPERGNQEQFRLFDTYRDKEGDVYLADTTLIKEPDFNKISFSNGMKLDKEAKRSGTAYRQGAVRLELSAPSEAFGYQLYTLIFPEIILYNAKHPSRKKPMPGLPYVPVVKSISINYTLEHSESLKPGKISIPGETMEVHHVGVFGNEEIYPGNGANDFSLLPVFNEAGHLYIGFNQLKPGEELSLLFQLEDKYFTDTTTRLTPLNWSYLADNKWHPFEGMCLLSDNTNNLSRSGIVKIRVPWGINTNNSIMSPDAWWIRISTPSHECITPRVIGIFPNAVTVERVFEGVGGSLEKVLSLPPLTIKNTKRDIRTIQAIWQLFPSFGGRKTEPESKFYTRVSERLRHKQRPVAALDIAQVLLEAFPEILIVKCITAPPGARDEDVSIVVVPRQSDSGLFISAEPKVDLDTLCRIQNFMQQHISPFVALSIRNPVYESVKVVCSIMFRDPSENNQNSHLQQLHLDIQKYLCPWLFDPSSHLKIGSTLYKSELLNYINRQPYVEYITGFSLVHFYYTKDEDTGMVTAYSTDTAIGDLQQVTPSLPQAVLIPSKEHLITVLRSPEYKEPEPLGIDALKISSELIIGNDHPVITPTDQRPDHATDEEMLTISIMPP